MAASVERTHSRCKYKVFKYKGTILGKRKQQFVQFRRNTLVKTLLRLFNIQFLPIDLFHQNLTHWILNTKNTYTYKSVSSVLLCFTYFTCLMTKPCASLCDGRPFGGNTISFQCLFTPLALAGRKSLTTISSVPGCIVFVFIWDIPLHT